MNSEYIAIRGENIVRSEEKWFPWEGKRVVESWLRSDS